MINSCRASALPPAAGAVIDEIADEFESAWKAGAAPRIEDFLARVDSNTDIQRAALRELLQVEVELRRKLSIELPADDYLERFASFKPLVLDVLHQSDVALATVAHRASGTRSGLNVRCPFCHNPVELQPDASLDDVSCSSCGGSFSLTGNSQDTQEAATLTRLGQFELIERLGLGAFGTVWKARDTQLHRTVAVKMPRKGQLGPEETEKFFREARSAAQLRHPNIVSVHEVGRDGDSVYIVSDYVQGVTLSDWLTGQQPTGREAAELCGKIAATLHYAHEQGVVHRDLKPANIMIDGDGEPHLMDFGLARREVGEVTMTMDGQVLGTPAYMSPEQAQGESHTADRRSDVYSLGVVLFQLLTSELPFRGNARMMMHQVINDEPPSPRKLNANIHKDLETITLKCLEKDVTRRFQTAKEMADELLRYLEGEPIRSRPINRVERAWRWCRRRPLVSSLGAGLAVSLLLGATIASIGYITTSRALTQKEQSAATAEQVSKFLSELFRSSDPIGFASGDNFEFVSRDASAANATARELLDRGAQRIDSELSSQPQVQATLQETIGGVYRELGLYHESAQLLEKALHKREAITPVDPLKIAAAKHNLGAAMYLGGNYSAAESYLRSALDTRRQLLGGEHLDTSSTLQSLGLVLGSAGQFDEAIEVLDEAIAIRRKLKGNDYQGVAIALATKVAVLLGSGDVEAARPAVAEALIIFSKQEGRSVAAEAIMDYQLAMVALDEEDYPAAVKHFKKTLDLSTRMLGSAHPYVVLTASDYAIAQHALGDIEGACQTCERAIKICEQTLPAKHPMVIRLARRLALLYVKLRRFEDALAMSDRVMADTREVLGLQTVEYADALSERAFLKRKLGQHTEATSLAKESSELAATLTLPPSRTLWPYRHELAECLLAEGKSQEAAAVFEEVDFANGMPDSFAPLDRIQKLDLLDVAGRANVAAGRTNAARSAFQLGAKVALSNPRPKPNWAAWFETQSAILLLQNGQLADAEQILSRTSRALAELEGANDIWTQTAQQALDSVRNQRSAEQPSDGNPPM